MQVCKLFRGTDHILSWPAVPLRKNMTIAWQPHFIARSSTSLLTVRGRQFRRLDGSFAPPDPRSRRLDGRDGLLDSSTENLFKTNQIGYEDIVIP
jgi:hypothetical protein